jgi:hypothetical protein
MPLSHLRLIVYGVTPTAIGEHAVLAASVLLTMAL